MPTRRGFLISGGVVVGAAAVGVPSYLWLRRDGLATPAKRPVGAGNTFVPLKFRPTWLPDGLVAVARQAWTGGPTLHEQYWSVPGTIEDAFGYLWGKGTKPEATLGVRPAAFTESAYVSVNGKPAARLSDGQETKLTWADGDSLLELSVQGGNHADDARRMAESVVGDGAVGVEVGMSFGWLPAGVGRDRGNALVLGGTGGWLQSLKYGEAGEVVATLFHGPPVDLGGDAITVRARPGRLRDGAVSVDLGDGANLSVEYHPAGAGPIPREDILRMAEELTLGPEADRSWIGARA